VLASSRGPSYATYRPQLQYARRKAKTLLPVRPTQARRTTRSEGILHTSDTRHAAPWSQKANLTLHPTLYPK